jgi:cohesin complex subunit SA-1/2
VSDNSDFLDPYPEEEEKPVRKRGRPRKVREVPDVPDLRGARHVRGKKLFRDDGHNSSGEESIGASDHQDHGEDDDSNGDADQPLINTIRSSAAKLRSLKISQQGPSSQKGVPGPSGTFLHFPFLHWMS